MTRAPAEQQKRLLDLQKLDTRLARIAHERRSLPVHARIADLETEAAECERERIETATRRSDSGRELARIESDVEQIHTRAKRHHERLMGGASAKEAQALEQELALLAGRTSELEDLELEQMEVVEQLDADLAAIKERAEAIVTASNEAIAEREKEFSRLDAEARSLGAERDALAGTLSADLVALYDEIREHTGGLGAIAIYGTRTEGVSIDFSLSEIHEINSAGPDDVVTSEEHGYILVRL